MVSNKRHCLSVIVPCYNEERTLETCIKRVVAIEDESLSLQIIIVDDCSSDDSPAVADRLSRIYPSVEIVELDKNQGKGAAVSAGVRHATGDFIAIQDADLEYNPMELKKLIQPLIDDDADAVFGSRYRSADERRVLYFWHSLGNKCLTFLSNMFTNLDLTDMETCYKIFRRKDLQKMEIKERRFGIEPELVAKAAEGGLRVYEMGISYHGRTYAEGKKLRLKDLFRALYCIYHYNAHRLPMPMQLVIYFIIGGICAATNVLTFSILYYSLLSIRAAAIVSFALAAALNYYLCIHYLFRHGARWKARSEIGLYIVFVSLVGVVDVGVTGALADALEAVVVAKLIASTSGFVLNFVGRKYLIF